MAIDDLLRFTESKYRLCAPSNGGQARVLSPPFLLSTLMIVAPRSASSAVA